MSISNQLPDPNIQDEAQDHLLRIIDARPSGPYYHPQHSSPFGLLCTFGGKGDYHINQRHYAIRDGHFLLINAGSNVEIEITAQYGINLFFVFFDPEALELAATAYFSSPTRLLDHPYDCLKGVGFIERLNCFDETLLSLVVNIKKDIAGNRDIQETFFNLYTRLLLVDHRNHKEIANLKAVKHATRQELYYRLYKAKDFIDACYADDLTLDSIASHATLNRFHLLRLFKQLFQQTPHQYLTTVRLQKARQQLLSTKKSVQEIVIDIGLDSVTSFSHLFKRKFGVSPGSLRSR